MTDRNTAEWALLRIAVAVFDAYAHGARVPSLARETSLVIGNVMQLRARSVPSIGIGMLLHNASTHLARISEGGVISDESAAKLRDYFKQFTDEGKEP